MSLDPASGTVPSLPRRVRYANFALGSVLHGAVMVALVYLSGLLYLVGDYRQLLYLLPGVFAGGILFPVLGDLLRRVGRAALPIALVLAVVGGVGVLWYNSTSIVITDASLVVRSFLCSVVGIPLAVLVVPKVALDPRSRRTVALAAVMGVGPIIMGISYAALYAAEGFEGFAWIVLGNEVGILVLLVLSLLGSPPRIFRSRAGSGSALPSDAPSPSRGPPAGAPQEEVSAVQVEFPPWRQRGASRRGPGSVAGVVAAFALAFLLTVPSPAVRAGSAPSSSARTVEGVVVAGSPRTPVQHLVLMMMENHAFDNFFGVYPSGGCAGSSNPALAAELPQPLNLENLSSLSPYAPDPCVGGGSSDLQELPNGTWSTPDPIEGYGPYHLDWDGGKMDGWLQGSGPAGLNYYTADALAPEWDLAEEYSLADNYFSSALTETLPNRLYSLAGFSPVMNDYGPPPYVPYDQSIFGELDHYRVSWGYYLNDPGAGVGTLNSIEGMSPSSPGIGTYSDFLQEASSGTLPSVSWVEPVDGGLDAQYDQEPPGNVLAGEMWMLDFVDALMQGPAWNSTAILLTYDEGGGFYDQVAPPTLDGELLGQRVPMMIISPYAKEAYVSNTELNHASQLALIDYNWGLPALNNFVADSNIPLDMFSFQAPPRAPYPLTAGQGFPLPTGFPFSAPSSADVFPLYPYPLQEPLADRPYGSYGSSSVDLAQSGGSPFVAQDEAYTPWYLSFSFLSALLLADVALFILLPRRGAPRPAPSGDRSPPTP